MLERDFGPPLQSSKDTERAQLTYFALLVGVLLRIIIKEEILTSQAVKFACERKNAGYYFPV